MSDISKLSIRELSSKVRKGNLDPEVVLNDFLARIDLHNPKLNALRFVARSEAKARASKLKESLSKGILAGALCGTVFSAKDSIDVSGLPRSDGTLLGSTSANLSQSSMVSKLFYEDAICLGKANMAEYGKSYFTDNSAFGRTNNPFNLEHTPGGSGGGDSSAVAADLAMFGLGADSGGSVRVPANFCGLFGYLPSRNILSNAGLANATHTIGTLLRGNGPLARSLDDLEILATHLSFFDSEDPYSLSFPAYTQTKIATKKFAFFSEVNGVKCDQQITNSLKDCAKRFEQLGYAPIETTPTPFSGSYEIFIIIAGQASLLLEDLSAQARGEPRVLANESPIVQKLRERITKELPPLTVDGLLKSLHRLDVLRHEALKIFQNYDFILAPVAACLAPKHGTSVYQVDGQPLQSQQVFQFASAVNTLALPAVAFPTGLSKEKLPLGLQIIGPRFSDRQLLRLLRDAGYATRTAPNLE